MSNANKTYDLKVEKRIAKTPAEVFRALSEGRLFTNCGADHEKLKIDFRVGGKYSIEFISYGVKTHGVFLEIVDNKKIAFTWCQDYEANPEPDTKVLIELKEIGGQTALTLTHTGFTDQENKENHVGGWNAGLDDLTQEITNGRLRLVRRVQMPVEKLYMTCKDLSSAFGIEGEGLEGEPNKKIVFKLKGGASNVGDAVADSTQVTLLFEADDDKNISWLEVIHEGLKSEALQKSNRNEWATRLKRL